MRIISKAKTILAVYRTFGFGETTKLIADKIRGDNFTAKTSLIPTDIDTLKSFQDIEKFVNSHYPGVNVITRDKFNELIHSLDSNKKRKGFFDSNFDIGDLALYALFLVIEKRKKATIMETGVAAGRSTSFILSLLDSHELGSILISTDITEKCGELIPENLKDKWEFQKIGSKPRQDFVSTLLKFPNISIFIHDSDHSKQWEIFEVSSVIAYCQKIEVMLVDDVDIEVVNLLKNEKWMLGLIQDKKKQSLLAIK